MGKAISETIFDAWVKRMEEFLLCYQKDRLLFLRELQQAEKAFEIENNCELNLNDDFLDGTSSLKKGNNKGGKKNRKFVKLSVTLTTIYSFVCRKRRRRQRSQLRMDYVRLVGEAKAVRRIPLSS